MKTYSVQELSVQVENLRQTVEFLTTIRPYRNSKNPHVLNRVASYIQDHLKSYGLTTEQQTFLADKTTYRNVIGTWGSHKPERIIIGAHYDVCGDQPGADDNASAVAGLLEMARLVSGSAPTVPYRIDFVAYSLEEPPYFASKQMGSYIHASSLHDQGISVKGMICLEMIGYFTTAVNSQSYPRSLESSAYPTIGNFIAIVGDVQSRELVQLLVRHLKKTHVNVIGVNVPPHITGVGFSDHRNYWEFGYPATMITDTAFYRNRRYHTRRDTMDTLDFDKMAAVVKGVAEALLNMRA